MHAYYEKNRKKLQKTMNRFLSAVAPEIERLSGVPSADALRDIWTIYDRDLLARFPYIGGDDAGGTKNLTEAYTLVAMGEFLKAHGAAMDEIGRVMTLAYERRMQKMPKPLRTIMGRMFTDPKTLNKLFRKKDAKNAANAAKNPGSFVTKTQIPPEAGYDFSYHNLVCPLANFAKQYGYEDYLPYLCNLDYVMFGVLCVPLFREQTCLRGAYCDFKLKTDAEPLPYWPPVFTQDNPWQ